MLTRAASDDPSLEASRTESMCEVDSESVSKQTDEERTVRKFKAKTKHGEI